MKASTNKSVKTEKTDKPVITVFNKQDKSTEPAEMLRDERADYVIKASVKTGMGIDEILGAVEEIIRNKKRYMTKLYSYEEAGKIQQIRKYGELLTEEYREDGIYVEAYVPVELSE